jgi:SAM-dependent methyltransferase
MTDVLPENAESQRAWDGVLFDRFLSYRHLILALAQYGTAAMKLYPPKPGDRVLDIGCGLGDSTRDLAALVGPTGSALGVDIAPRFIELASEENANIPNLRYETHDVQATRFDQTFDYAFARFGTMFFANPVAALRNVRAALTDDGRLVIVVWRRREDNPWMYVAEQVVKPLVEIPEETDEARCGPGPFSMAGADTVSTILRTAGYDEITFRRVDLPIMIGTTLDEAIEFNLALGPAAEAVRLAGEDGDAMRPHLGDLLRNALGQFVREDGTVVADASTWVITASPA